MRETTIGDLLGRQLNELELENAASKLYIDGPMALPLQSPKVSVVGTRNPTEGGVREADSLTEWLVDHGVTVVSGLAAGIDAQAHRTAIRKGGQTVAVIGTPLDRQYPRSNTQLQLEIATNHLVVSQFRPGRPVSRSNFLVRNRTMAIISDVTVVVEAGSTGGTVHRAWESVRLKKPLFVCRPVIKADPEWLGEMMRYGATRLETYEDVLSGMPLGVHA